MAATAATVPPHAGMAWHRLSSPLHGRALWPTPHPDLLGLGLLGLGLPRLPAAPHTTREAPPSHAATGQPLRAQWEASGSALSPETLPRSPIHSLYTPYTLLRPPDTALRLPTLPGAAAACALLLGGATLLLHLASRLASRLFVTGGEALGFALLFGLGYGGCYALVQSKAALHFGHRPGFKTLQGFLFVWQMMGAVLASRARPAKV